MNTKNTIPIQNDMVKDLTSELSIHFCNMYTLQLMCKNFEWHVEGPYYKSMRDLFSEQHKIIDKEINDLAERMRVLDMDVPVAIKLVNELSEIRETNIYDNADQMLDRCVEATSTARSRCTKAFKKTSFDCDEVTAEMLMRHLKLLEKSVWKLKSSMDNEPKGNFHKLNEILDFESFRNSSSEMEAH